MSQALDAREALEECQERHQRAYLRYLRDARRAGWSWERIAQTLELSDVAVRRYWERNRQRADRSGDVESDSAVATA